MCYDSLQQHGSKKWLITRFITGQPVLNSFILQMILQELQNSTVMIKSITAFWQIFSYGMNVELGLWIRIGLTLQLDLNTPVLALLTPGS